MASQLLADPSDYQKNLKITVFTRHLGVEKIYFNELGCTREEIIAEHAPELLPWLLSYMLRSDDNPTVEEMAARYERNLAALHALLLHDTHYGMWGGNGPCARIRGNSETRRVERRGGHLPLPPR